MADMTVAYSPSHGLGEEQSIWFKLTPLLNQENPMQVLMALSEKYGGVIPINLKNQRVILLSEPAHAQRVLVDNADGRMLETGLIRGNSAPACRPLDGDASCAEGRFLECGRARGKHPWPSRPKPRELGGRRKWRI